MVEEPTLPFPHKVRRRLQHGDAALRQFESEKSMFRSQYFEAIDACLVELNRRFDEKSYAPLVHFNNLKKLSSTLLTGNYSNSTIT